MTRQLGRDDYTVGWVCALPIELAAAQEMLDEEHQDLLQIVEDANIYSLGRIGEHNIVIAGLPAGQTGIASATAVAMRMKSSFPSIRFGLMVGIGGGVPSTDADIRLGDIVVSQPEKGHGGVIQYDFGKSTPNGFEQTGFLNTPPPVLLSAITKLQAYHDRGRNDLSHHLAKLSNLPKFARDRAGSDLLFHPEYDHEGNNNCSSCEDTRQIKREDRMDWRPVVYYGTIASGNQVMRDGRTRDKVSSEFKGVLCFEMEAAGLMNSFPCLVIRGICDYADSHKNKRWQPYAAGSAAAYAKELLLVIPAADVLKTQTADKATQEHSRTHYIPFLRNRQFVGRSTELNRLNRKLFQDADCQKVAISGLGGIGKTQVALQFAYSVKEDHPELSIFWVQALSMESFERGCMEIARALGIHQGQESKEDVKMLVRRWLCAKSAGKWLLIVDNADDLDLLSGPKQTDGLLSFLPESDDGLTVFTTRFGGIAQYLAGSDVIDIGKMAEQETIDLLEKSLIRKSPPYNENIIRNLLTELEYLPLAITQAAAYINTNKSSIFEYLRLLKNTDQDAVAILSMDFGDKTRYPNLANAIAKTWLITFNKILEHDSLAANLLAFISCIEWRAIPYSILPAVRPEARLAAAVGTLCSYSFLERRDDKKLDMHRLVHFATRRWIVINDREANTAMAALKQLLDVFPSNDYKNREIWRDYLPHVARIDKNGRCQNTQERSELCLKVGQCLFVDGRMREAVQWMQKSCDWRDRNLPADHPSRVASQHVLAAAYQANGQIKEAIKLREDIASTKSDIFTKDHPFRLVSQYALAEAYRANGQIKEAVKLLKHIVTKEAEISTTDHSSRLLSHCALATAYLADGQIKEAVKLLKHIVTKQAEIFAEDHPNRLAPQHALARAYLADGQIKEAVKLLKHIVTKEAETFAEDHPSRLASQCALAEAYLADGQIKEAVRLLEHVATKHAETFAEDHPSRLASQHMLARAYQANGQIEEAVKLREHVHKIRQGVLTPLNPLSGVAQGRQPVFRIPGASE